MTTPHWETNNENHWYRNGIFVEYFIEAFGPEWHVYYGNELGVMIFKELSDAKQFVEIHHAVGAGE